MSKDGEGRVIPLNGIQLGKKHGIKKRTKELNEKCKKNIIIRKENEKVTRMTVRNSE